jgi:hypothetical protein
LIPTSCTVHGPWAILLCCMPTPHMLTVGDGLCITGTVMLRMLHGKACRRCLTWSVALRVQVPALSRTLPSSLLSSTVCAHRLGTCSGVQSHYTPSELIVLCPWSRTACIPCESIACSSAGLRSCARVMRALSKVVDCGKARRLATLLAFGTDVRIPTTLTRLFVVPPPATFYIPRFCIRCIVL